MANLKWMKRHFSVAILVKGFSGLVAQILLLRELLIVFSGNELSIGIILANWLILGAFGSYIVGRRAERSKHTLEAFAVITILFALSLLIAIYLTRILKVAMGISIGPFCRMHTSRRTIHIQLPDTFPVFQPGCIFCRQGLCV
jgi:spermidine synthase